MDRTVVCTHRPPFAAYAAPQHGVKPFRQFSALVVVMSLAALIAACSPKAQLDVEPVTPPVRLWSPPLVYPPEMFAAGIEGRVLVQGVVDSTGRIDASSIRVLRSSDPAFDGPAITVFRGTRFKPAEQEGHPVRALVEVPVTFALASVSIDSVAGQEAVARGARLIRSGKFDEAMLEFSTAQAQDPRLSASPSFWLPVCWYGTLWDHAADVLPACDDLVALAPAGATGWRARGVARALTGDFTGAVEDFEAALRGPVDAGTAQVLRGWIAELRANRNPITRAVLDSLRAQPGPMGGVS